MVAQSTYASNRPFHPSTFGVLPAAERLAIATKALRDLAREQRKRAKHAAEVRKLCPIFPAWPVPVASVESRSQPGRFYTCDLESSMCDCPARGYCAHLESALAVWHEQCAADLGRARHERRALRALVNEYPGPLFHDGEVAA